LALPAFSVNAEEVRHHDFLVEANGTIEDCLACHDGMIAHNVRVCTTQCSVLGVHSVMTHYPPPGKITEYAPAAVVKAKGIKLLNNKVACVSCHNLRNPAKNHLITVSGKSGLCGACHIRE
jgi:hypothetical protein